jgi:hypothetical protein
MHASLTGGGKVQSGVRLSQPPASDHESNHSESIVCIGNWYL